jgi:hypothetical protein
MNKYLISAIAPMLVSMSGLCEVPAVHGTVILAVPETTTYLWVPNAQLKGNDDPTAICSGSGCNVYVDHAPRVDWTKVQDIVRLLLPDGRIAILGCYRLNAWDVDMCNVPRAGAPVDAQFFPKTRDVRLTMLRSGNHPKMVHEYYVLLSYLQPKDNKTSAGSKANGVN